MQTLAETLGTEPQREAADDLGPLREAYAKVVKPLLEIPELFGRLESIPCPSSVMDANPTRVGSLLEKARNGGTLSTEPQRNSPGPSEADLAERFIDWREAQSRVESENAGRVIALLGALRTVSSAFNAKPSPRLEMDAHRLTDLLCNNHRVTVAQIPTEPGKFFTCASRLTRDYVTMSREWRSL